MSPTASTDLDARIFREAMRRPASAVAVVASGAVGQRAGLTVTAVCSLSDAPPTVLVCVNRKSTALETILARKSFSVNFLHDHQSGIAEIFAGRAGSSGEDRFQTDLWAASPMDVPLLRDALVSFDCRLDQEVESSTHAILIGRVLSVIFPATQDSVLVYSQGGFGRFKALAMSS